MQTFLPYPSYIESARVLDRQRLGKQRVECKQLLNALGFYIVDGALFRYPEDIQRKIGWSNHPAAKMWRGYEEALAVYQSVIIQEWERRGYTNNLDSLSSDDARIFKNPTWLGDEAFHASHRSNLLRKDPQWYGQFGWTESPDLSYVWPTVPELGPQQTISF